MSDNHTPRYWKAMLGVAGGVIVICIGLLIPNERIFWTMLIAGFLSCALGILQAVSASISHHTYMNIDYLREKRLLFETYKGSTADEKSIIGRLFPEIDVEITNRQKTYYWRGTSVPVDVLQEFLLESTKESTVAQRNWKARGRVTREDGSIVDYHWCWFAIYNKLVEMNYVIKESHNGPRSELWRGRAYERLCYDWLEKEYQEL